MSTVSGPSGPDQPSRDPYVFGLARARCELTSGEVSTDVAVALLALLAALDVACDGQGGVDLPARYRREMVALAVDIVPRRLDLPGADR